MQAAADSGIEVVRVVSPLQLLDLSDAGRAEAIAAAFREAAAAGAGAAVVVLDDLDRLAEMIATGADQASFSQRVLHTLLALLQGGAPPPARVLVIATATTPSPLVRRALALDALFPTQLRLPRVGAAGRAAVLAHFGVAVAATDGDSDDMGGEQEEEGLLDLQERLTRRMAAVYADAADAAEDAGGGRPGRRPGASDVLWQPMAVRDLVQAALSLRARAQATTAREPVTVPLAWVRDALQMHAAGGGEPGVASAHLREESDDAAGAW